MDAMEKAARARREALETITGALAVSSDAMLVNVFTGYGGRIRDSAGAYLARLYGVTASCTVSETAAVKAWLHKAQQDCSESGRA